LQCGVADAICDFNLVETPSKRRRQHWATLPVSSPFSRGDAWSSVVITPADYLPFHTGSNMAHFKVNQFCESCTHETLCTTHEAMRNSENVDLTRKHMAAITAAGYCLVECGGNGDCFYHSMLFIAQLFVPELYNQWQTHQRFRETVCKNLLMPEHQPTVSTMTFLDYLKVKYKHSGKGSKVSNAARLNNYVGYHKKCSRRERGQTVNGAFVENEILAAVSLQYNIIINVAHVHFPGLCVSSPDGVSAVQYDDERAQSSPFLLFCNGGHYQAIIPIQEIEILDSAAASAAFQESNLLHSKDVRKKNVSDA
jgi:hypothetical protein